MFLYFSPFSFPQAFCVQLQLTVLYILNMSENRENACYNFTDLKARLPNCWFCLTKIYTVINILREKQHIFICRYWKRLYPQPKETCWLVPACCSVIHQHISSCVDIMCRGHNVDVNWLQKLWCITDGTTQTSQGLQKNGMFSLPRIWRKTQILCSWRIKACFHFIQLCYNHLL